MTTVLVAALAFLAAIALPRLVGADRHATRIAAAETWLARHGAWLAAGASVALVWYVWGELAPIAKIQDETSYLLQAEIFARLRWTVPSPPLPEFFEQPHVLVVPAVASKYPPGHALLLAIGSLLRFPTLVPLLLTGATAFLIFALTTRVANVWIALLTWGVWATSPMVLKFQPSYLSEVTTGFTVLASWWCLLEWRATGRRRWLLLMALAIGWGAITRPLTALVFAIPVGIVVLVDVARGRRWKDLGLALLVGVLVLGVLPLWSARTTGDWRVWPVELYRRDYMPFDKPGFSVDTTPPRRAVSPPVRSLNDYFLTSRKALTAKALPDVIIRRSLNLATGMFQNIRLPLLLFAFVGLFFMPTAIRFALAGVVLLFAAHLSYAHDPSWTVYYLETAPVIACLVALGLWHASRRLGGGAMGAPAGAALSFAVLAGMSLPVVRDWREDHRIRSAFDRRFAGALAQLESPAIVFLRYSPRFAVHPSVVFNFADPERAPVWVVQDLGARNAALRQAAPQRRAYLIDEEDLLRWAIDPTPRPLPVRAP